MSVTVSVIITVLNGRNWIESCFESILRQVGTGEEFILEVCIFDDASSDDTVDVILSWAKRFQLHRIQLVLVPSDSDQPKGVGHGRNEAIRHSSGSFFCFQDIDDVMFPTRISRQLEMCQQAGSRTIIGSKFVRYPKDSTARFTKWANNLASDKLEVQIYTSHGPTVIMPTWFCHCDVVSAVGGFETGRGVPEDLIFFYKHLEAGGTIERVDEPLLCYTYHPLAATFSIHADTIWSIRMCHLIKHVLAVKPWCNGFTIWNANKQGRRFYRALPDYLQLVVSEFCDVDPKLIGTSYVHYDKGERKERRRIPIVSFLDARPPLIICFKLDLSQGSFEKNLQSLDLVEGKDYVLFS